MQKLRPGEISWPAQGPTALSSPLARVLRSCWVTSRSARQRPSGAGVCSLLPEFRRQLWQPHRPHLPRQPHSRHSAQARKRPARGRKSGTTRQGVARREVSWGPGLLALWVPQHSRCFSQARPQATQGSFVGAGGAAHEEKD